MLTHVLLVEDNPGDIRLIQEAFRQAKRPIRLHVAYDGVEAMAFLWREGDHVGAPRPDIIVLDLNLPRMDGREVLPLIKKDDSLRTIPTLVLTSSDAASDVAKIYQLQANCYLMKPSQWEAFDAVVKSINDFWLTRVTLPREGQSQKIVPGWSFGRGRHLAGSAPFSMHLFGQFHRSRVIYPIDIIDVFGSGGGT